MDRHAKLSDHAAAEIAALTADGIALTPAEIVRINALSWAVESGENRQRLSRGIPVAVGGAWLWPWTMHGSEWWERVGLSMPSALQPRAMAYALAFGRSSGSKLDVEGEAAESAVMEWAAGLRCRLAELLVAVGRVLDQDEEEEPQDGEGKPQGDKPEDDQRKPGISAGELSAFLCAAVGGPPELWERKVSSGYTLAILRAVVEQNKAEDRPGLDDRALKAERALGLAVAEIRKAHADG